MKKVFLSLATIAFVAAGSLTVTSCGGDDSVAPGPVPEPELTENFVKYDGEQHKLDGAEYTIDTEGENVAIYSNEAGNMHYASYTTYFWSGDIESAQSLADLAAFGQISYYVQLLDVEYNAEGEVIAFDLPLPNEAEELQAYRGGASFEGINVTGITDAAINVNTFSVTQGAGTSDFDGSLTFASALTFDYSGNVTYLANDIAKGKAFSKLTVEGSELETSAATMKLNRNISTVKISEVK